MLIVRVFWGAMPWPWGWAPLPLQKQSWAPGASISGPEDMGGSSPAPPPPGHSTMWLQSWDRGPNLPAGIGLGELSRCQGQASPQPGSSAESFLERRN